MGVRRVVTGHQAGRAVVVSDESIDPVTLAIMPGAEFLTVWGADEPCTFPDDGAAPPIKSYFPPVEGFRFGMFTIPAATAPAPAEDLDFVDAVGEIVSKLPGFVEHMELDGSGFHTTSTIDFEFVVSGHPILELDDGLRVPLSPGDTVVQNGTRHAWRNDAEVPAVLAFCTVGAQRR